VQRRGRARPPQFGGGHPGAGDDRHEQAQSAQQRLAMLAYHVVGPFLFVPTTEEDRGGPGANGVASPFSGSTIPPRDFLRPKMLYEVAADSKLLNRLFSLVNWLYSGVLAIIFLVY